jgi:hypothetical protein
VFDFGFAAGACSFFSSSPSVAAGSSSSFFSTLLSLLLSLSAVGFAISALDVLPTFASCLGRRVFGDLLLLLLLLLLLTSPISYVLSSKSLAVGTPKQLQWPRQMLDPYCSSHCQLPSQL